MLDGRRVGEPEIGTPQCGGNLRMRGGERTDVQLVEHRLLPRHLRRHAGVCSARGRHHRDPTAHPACVRIQQQHRWITGWPVHPVAVALTRTDAVLCAAEHGAVPHPVGPLGQVDTAFSGCGVEQTQLNPFRVSAGHDKAGPFAMRVGAEGERGPGTG